MSDEFKKPKNRDKDLDVVTRDESIENLLVSGEEIIHEGFIHWGIFLSSALYAFIGVLLMIVWNIPVGVLVLLMTSVPLINAIILYTTTRLVLTNKRVFTKFGFFNRDVIQIRHDKVESAHLERPFLGQFLGYSTVVIRGVGTGSIPVPFISNGSGFVRAVEEYTMGENSK